MRAIHKYNSKDKEGARRIAQSMGYRFSIWDMPDTWFAFMARAGITFDNIDYTGKQPEENIWNRSEDNMADTDTIKI